MLCHVRTLYYTTRLITNDVFFIFQQILAKEILAMQKIFRWMAIAEELRNDVVGGRYQPGQRLDSEELLARRFGVNRHTVRRALAVLRDEGLISSRRGSGIFVNMPVTPYHISNRTRFSENVSIAGHQPSARVIRLERLKSGPSEAEFLKINVGDPVILLEGVGYADNVPILFRRSFLPLERTGDVRDVLEATGSVTEAMKSCGFGDYSRFSTKITAEPASVILAGLLQCSRGDALLCSTALNVVQDDVPIEYGQSWFVGTRVNLVFDTPK